MITVRGLAKRYRRRRVLEDVSFTVPRGMLTGIQGENGAGKSTLLKCLVGLLKPDAGQIVLDGRVGYCPQDPSLIESLTLTEQFRLFGAGYGLTPDQVADRAGTLMEEFGCARYATTRVDRLSGGTRQKVNLIAALLHEPDVLILDEPYQGFDYDTYQHFWDYTERFRVDGGSVVVVSHMHTEIARFDAMLDLAAGRVTASGRRAKDVVLTDAVLTDRGE
ncbi:ABC transporter ATP-binding protein [Acrocarpospora phusangensis]|uniref:ABC transporter ATP-binding protein n=1 Tax=Acrocarpospora phusangensis TaxID=1070424 RepID=A0A919ULE8_9ACTN|nr:ABC transporter ATP-binding protein [Acrocarpospora phusangensis]GIH22233.1 ABC transporter ATP-binding protein [Acrocarpospora phusangensis]